MFEQIIICNLTLILFNKYIISPFSFPNLNVLGFSPPFFYKQSIFDPRSKNCLSFSEKSPPKIV